MALHNADLWHQILAQRDDGVDALFLIRQLEPRADLPRVLVIELPYTTRDETGLPDATALARLDGFEEGWIEPACEDLGWTYVAVGLFSLYRASTFS